MRHSFRFIAVCCLAQAGMCTDLFAQQVYGESVISVTASQVTTYSATEMDYATSYYYDAEADGFLWQNGSIIRSGSGLGNPTGDGYMSAPTAVNSTYEIQTNHWLVAYYFIAGYGYSDPYGYSLLGGGDYGGTGVIYAPGSAQYAGAASYYVGSTYLTTTSKAPVVTGLQVYSGDPVPGGSGYIVLYGTDLTTYWGPTTISSGSDVSTSVSYASPTQINITYAIAGGAGAGSKNITVNTLFGASSQTFTVYPPATTLLSDDSLSGGVQSWSNNGDGTFTLQLSPLLYDYLADNGFLPAAAGTLVFIPGVGEVVIAVGGAVVVTAGVIAAYQWWTVHKYDTPPRLPRPKNPPTGTVPIDKYPGLSHDQIEKIKENIGHLPADWTGVAPNGDVITGDVNGNAENHGPWQGLAH